MKPKVAPTFTQHCLVIFMDFFMANSARVYGWGTRIGRVEHHWLVGWIDLGEWIHASSMLHGLRHVPCLRGYHRGLCVWNTLQSICWHWVVKRVLSYNTGI
ncbi:hypothetical protein EGW08_010189 [Elysia chlorotica]|uniref:Uncharacterized protein n=1 Tax=Elysia chlorotica TaxID=188477 RepID=A0A3S1C3K6_ELYCH|nr:hypothetical protein EGW08_010189 [Elysia chlorotica]